LPASARTFRLQETQPQEISWLWPGHLAAGRLALIDGDPEQGKSLLTLDLAARLTSGRPFPDGYQPCEPSGVLLLSAEDGLADTIAPRLRAAGADFSRVYTWDRQQDWPPTFPESCPELQKTIEETRARLVVLDPFFAFLGEEVGSLNDLMIRRALDPLMQVAAATQAAIWLVRHLSKVRTSVPASYRGLGSVAILGATRTAFLVARDPDEPQLRVFACTKNNLAARPPSLGFRIVQTADRLPLIEWLGVVNRTADDLVQTGRGRGEAIPRGLAFLERQLAGGPCKRQTLLDLAEQAGISLRTLERAKALLGVLSEQRREEGRNVWYWKL
jgi:hypothetical protein